MRFFVTGTAGFIGFHLAARLLADGHEVYGFDGMTPYYDVGLKRARHERLREWPRFSATEAMLEEQEKLWTAYRAAQPEVVVHLAAQPGVRYSVEAPETYVSANLVGTFHLLEAVRRWPPAHLLMASTSSVYGGNPRVPFREIDPADWPLSFYAATKKAAEAMSHAYAHLYRVPTTVFRFFTVYGPWGRPDMALFKFTRAILKGEEVEIYNRGEMWRDFTYVGDLVEGVVRLVQVVPPAPEQRGAEGESEGVTGDTLSPVAPWRVVNIGNGVPVRLDALITAIEKATGCSARPRYLPRPPGEALQTWADCSLLERLTGFRPQTPLEEGVRRFVEWFSLWERVGSAKHGEEEGSCG
ncbi:MAG: GDP-mannose 4,6-dehydratase [Hydrogenophilus sp.]|nr:GDP-mannose 4,6-dehydratase [Hydrogenophilus sp.]